MPHSDFEYLLAEHCAPTLLSHKCASLVTLSRRSFPNTSFIAPYSRLLSEFGISCRIICRCRKRRLLLLYRQDMLSARLREPDAAHLLLRCGYPAHASLEELLQMLEERFSSACGTFPHEIGLFLGYPASDVAGFIQNKGEGCLFCGYWKVYSKPEEARLCFALYDRCRAHLFRCLREGKTISTLLSAA